MVPCSMACTNPSREYIFPAQDTLTMSCPSFPRKSVTKKNPNFSHVLTMLVPGNGRA